MFKKILLAYDGSEAGQKALLESKEIAQWSDADLTLVAVTPLTAEFMGPEGGIYDLRKLEHEKSAFQKTLEIGVADLQAAGYRASGEVLMGDIVAEIARHARKIKAQLIVVGHKHQDGWPAHWWRSSISKVLIDHAPCSVLVVVA